MSLVKERLVKFAQQFSQNDKIGAIKISTGSPSDRNL